MISQTTNGASPAASTEATESIAEFPEVFIMEVYAYIALGIVIFAAVSGLIIYLRPERQYFSPDDMEGLEFEQYCALLLEANGFEDVEVTKGSGDYGVDILAVKDMVTYGIQCKVYSSPVGVRAVQEAYAGRDYYDRMVGAVLTNQYFTKPADDAARRLKILLWDRDYLEQLIDNADDI